MPGFFPSVFVLTYLLLLSDLLEKGQDSEF